MRLFPDFSPKKNETVLSFGLSWSLVGSMVALTYLASCSYIIPENTRPPRYNTVLGEKRVPPKNMQQPAGNYAPQQQQRMAPVQQYPSQQQYFAPQQNPVPQQTMPPQSQLTPTPPRPQEQSFVQNTGAAAPRPTEQQMAAAAPEDYSWWNPQGWFAGAKPAEPRNTPVAVQPSANYTNQMTSVSAPAPMMQPLPDANSYPALQDTPLSPLSTGQAQARDKLNMARTDMEAELNAANMRANQLRSDAYSETSILSTMPEYNQPVSAPVVQSAPVEPLPSVTRPASVISNDLPPPPKVASPVGKSAASDEIDIAEPITLKAPAGKGEPIETAGISTGLSTMDPSTSTFDPMAGSSEPIALKAPEGTYKGTRYLPESRYTTRRAY